MSRQNRRKTKQDDRTEENLVETCHHKYQVVETDSKGRVWQICLECDRRLEI